MYTIAKEFLFVKINPIIPCVHFARLCYARLIQSGNQKFKQILKSPIVPGTYYHVKMSYDGTKLSVSVDGVSMPDVTVSGLDGSIGFKSNKGTAKIDDIQVQ